MKKVLFILILIASLSILVSVESDPSETVGYVKYDALTGLNLVAMPMDDGMMFCSEVGTYMSPDDYVDTINLWNNATQSYDASVNYGGGFWDPDNMVGPGEVLFFNTAMPLTYYSIGAMPAANAQYNILPGLNNIMLPLNKSALSFTSLVGTDIGPSDEIDTINLWNNATQSYDAAVNYGGGFWDPDYPVSIGTPMFISSSSAITWPAGPRGTGLSTPSTSRK
jgi:hypothetical protein